jgi:putative endopeptidase
MGNAVGKLYVERYFSPEAEARRRAVHNLLVAMGDRIDNNTDERRHQKGGAPLAKFTVKIGYPEQWRDYGKLKIAKDDLMGNVFRARAFEADYQIVKL